MKIYSASSREGTLSSSATGRHPGGLLGFPYVQRSSAADEVFERAGFVRATYARFISALELMGVGAFRTLVKEAEDLLLCLGATFLDTNKRPEERDRILPFDPIARIVSANEWRQVRRGIEQRLRALNYFLQDVYSGRSIVADGVVPEAAIEGSPGFNQHMRGVEVPGGVHIHVAGIDLVRDASGQFVVLEDNLRTPSGVGYVLANRYVMRTLFPALLAELSIENVEAYGEFLYMALTAAAPRVSASEPIVVVLTPGAFNAAYFEHVLLAKAMGCLLVRPSDLRVDQSGVYVETVAGSVRADVVYRRVDDDFLDPTVYRRDSLLGVPGLWKAYADGKVSLANAPGNGVADDKSIFPFVPDIIRYYLSEEPILPQVPTIRGADSGEAIRAHLQEFVVKPTSSSGGQGVCVCSQLSAEDLRALASAIEASPSRYVAQPLVELSTCPTWNGAGFDARRVDFRPYAVMTSRDRVFVLPGGLTRVAASPNSYIVNSCQGGGGKDTWVLRDRLHCP